MVVWTNELMVKTDSYEKIIITRIRNGWILCFSSPPNKKKKNLCPLRTNEQFLREFDAERNDDGISCMNNEWN